jgi:hypothetical protein
MKEALAAGPSKLDNGGALICSKLLGSEVFKGYKFQ